MKKLAQLLAVLAVLVAVTGCLDSQDGSGGRPKSEVTFNIN